MGQYERQEIPDFGEILKRVKEWDATSETDFCCLPMPTFKADVVRLANYLRGYNYVVSLDDWDNSNMVIIRRNK